MTFEQEIAAIDNLAKSCRDRAQANDLLEQEVSMLKQDNASLSATLESLTAVSKRDEADLNGLRDKYENEVRNNGELKATLKQLLAEQMALASRAAEMLMSLEEKPTPALEKTVIKIEKPTFSTDLKNAQIKDKEERLLERLVTKTLDDISKVPAGRTFVLDAPYGNDITDWILKRWYRRIIYKTPSNFKDAPSIELAKRDDGSWNFIKQVPKLTNTNDQDAKLTMEGREPLPFRTEDNIIQTAFPPDDGQELPKFLTNGIRDDNRETGERA
jgi:hypothetical protein